MTREECLPVPTRQHCAICDKSASPLVVCSRCQVVYYCSQDHQMEHHEAHKGFCEAMGMFQNLEKSAWMALDEEADTSDDTLDETDSERIRAITRYHPYVRMYASIARFLLEYEGQPTRAMIEKARHCCWRGLQLTGHRCQPALHCLLALHLRLGEDEELLTR